MKIELTPLEAATILDFFAWSAGVKPEYVSLMQPRKIAAKTRVVAKLQGALVESERKAGL